MFKVGDKAIISSDKIWLIKTGSIPEYFQIGEIVTIEEVDTNTYMDDNTVTYLIRNEKGFSYTDDTEIESLRKHKLKRVLCIK